MTTSPVMTVTDELIAELEASASSALQGGSEWYGEGCCLYSYLESSDANFMVTASPALICALLAERAELKRQNDDLRKLLAEEVISSTMLTGFVAGCGGFNIELQGGACALLAESFGQMLYESDAANYIEATFESEHYKELGQITVTVKRESGRTPHQLRAIAENECAELKRDAARYRWLRERVGVIDAFGQYETWMLADGRQMYDLERNETNAAIDAAMQADQ